MCCVWWFVTVETGHYFTRYGLIKSSSSLCQKCSLKRYSSLGHESSFARQLSHERSVIPAKSLWSPGNMRSITMNAEDRNFLSYKYMPHERPWGRGLFGMWSQKYTYCLSFFVLIPTGVSLGIGAPSPLQNSVFCLFLGDPH